MCLQSNGGCIDAGANTSVMLNHSESLTMPTVACRDCSWKSWRAGTIFRGQKSSFMMQHDTLIFISGICNFWPKHQILGKRVVTCAPSLDPAFPSPCWKCCLLTCCSREHSHGLALPAQSAKMHFGKKFPTTNEVVDFFRSKQLDKCRLSKGKRHFRRSGESL